MNPMFKNKIFLNTLCASILLSATAFTTDKTVINKTAEDELAYRKITTSAFTFNEKL